MSFNPTYTNTVKSMPAGITRAAIIARLGLTYNDKDISDYFQGIRDGKNKFYFYDSHLIEGVCYFCRD